VTLGLTALTREKGPDVTRASGPTCPRGPSLQLDLGVRGDREAVVLRRVQLALGSDNRAKASRLLAPYSSVQARVAAAVAAWPRRTVAALRSLASEHPRSGVVRLNLGAALFCDGQRGAAQAQWRAARRVAPDSFVAVRATDLLHPEYAPGIPVFVPSFQPPSRLAGLSPPRRLAALARSARGSDVRAKLLYGVALQQLGRQLSAERVYAAAARVAPNDVDAQTAAAVALFDKDDPARAFSRLGPLSGRFPRAATVRFHLGLLLLWLGRVDEGKRQLVIARRLAPASPIGREAARFLARLERT
jgi:tetratricopeptide (TPR) repeat protein